MHFLLMRIRTACRSIAWVAMLCALMPANHAGPVKAAERPPKLSVRNGDGGTPSPRLKRTFRHSAMYTTFEFIVYGREGERDPFALEQLAEQAFESIDSLERRISIWQETSEVSYVNAHAAERPVAVDREIIDLILVCKQLNADTSGAFDPTVGPLLDLWGLYKEQGHMPSPEELRDAVSLVGLKLVEVDPESLTVRFTRPGVKLDFGGIGKGFALDRAATLLRKYGITSALLVAGGSTLVAIGAPPGECGWRVEIRDPQDLTRSLREVLIADESLSTSGCYEPQIYLEGKSLCHIVDPRTGVPVKGMLSASAVGPTGVITDGLSTAFMVMGAVGIREFVETHPEVKAAIIEDRAPQEPEVTLVNFGTETGSKVPKAD